MPFELCNSPSVFSRFSSKILRTFMESNELIIYMDDLLIATGTLRKHLDILRRVLKTLIDNKLKLRLDKYSLVYQHTIYLGYFIDMNGIRSSDETISGV
ncbi:MAG: reverse transcriptase domain-containing protein [Rickettsiaceae bacterium]|nr:reverse transcriptase domain-containing protein [Rickettsiaceae bacterium]